MSARRVRYEGGATRQNSNRARRCSSELTNMLREDIREPEAQDIEDVITPTDRTGRRKSPRHGEGRLKIQAC